MEPRKPNLRSLLFLYTLISLNDPDNLIPPEEYIAFNTVANPLTKCGPGELLSPKTLIFTGLNWVNDTSIKDLFGESIRPEKYFKVEGKENLVKYFKLLFNILNFYIYIFYCIIIVLLYL